MIHGTRHRRTPKSTSFLISTLWLIRSKAFEKSKKQRRRCLLGESRQDNQVCIMSRRQNAVDVPFKQPNWLGAILFLISSIIHVTTKSKWPIIYQNSSHDYQKKQRAQRSYLWTWLPSNLQLNVQIALFCFTENRTVWTWPVKPSCDQIWSCYNLVTILVKLSTALENCKMQYNV